MLPVLSKDPNSVGEKHDKRLMNPRVLDLRDIARQTSCFREGPTSLTFHTRFPVDAMFEHEGRCGACHKQGPRRVLTVTIRSLTVAPRSCIHNEDSDAQRGARLQLASCSARPQG